MAFIVSLISPAFNKTQPYSVQFFQNHFSNHLRKDLFHQFLSRTNRHTNGMPLVVLRPKLDHHLARSLNTQHSFSFAQIAHACSATHYTKDDADNNRNRCSRDRSSSSNNKNNNSSSRPTIFIMMIATMLLTWGGYVDAVGFLNSGNHHQFYSQHVIAAPVLEESQVDTIGVAQTLDGAKLFENNCAGCHPGGGNIIGYARGKTLKQKALMKNDLYSEEAIISFTKVGKGAMPAFENKLSDQELSAVSNFIMERAANNWK